MKKILNKNALNTFQKQLMPGTQVQQNAVIDKVQLAKDQIRELHPHKYVRIESLFTGLKPIIPILIKYGIMKRKHRSSDVLPLGKRAPSETDTSVDNLTKFIGKDPQYRYEGTTT